MCVILHHALRAASMLCLVSVPNASAQQPGVPKPPWGLGMDGVVPITLPAALRDQVDLEYQDTDTIRGAVVDLNGDGVPDYIVQSAPSLCGNGGCPYQLFDGASRRDLGQVMGNPLYIQDEQTHGYPVITTYSHESAESGNYTTYAFNGTAYAVTTIRHAVGGALDSLVARLRRIPMWKPRGGSP